MAEYLQPGVYVEEIARGPRPIEGVATSTAALLGETERGPTRPRLVTSVSEYRRWFGDHFDDGKYMPQAVSGFFENGGQRVYIARVVGKGATAASGDFGGVKVTAIGPGDWGRLIFVEIGASTTRRADPDQPSAAEPVGFRLRVAYWSRATPGFEAFDPFSDPGRLPRPQVMEEYDDVSLEAGSPMHWETFVNGRSALVEVDAAAPADRTFAATQSGMLTQAGAAGAAVTLGDFEGRADAPNPSGLGALTLDDYRDIALVLAPGVTATDIQAEIVRHCESQRYRFAVLDAPNDGAPPAAYDPRARIADSAYAAFYYPWIQVSDAVTGSRRYVPPGGHVLGVFARTDLERGVFKAPANEGVRGALDLQFSVDDRLQDVLNPLGVNAIRKLPGRGIRVWGARTLSSDALWKYVSVRRLFIFLKRSIYEGTQWVVFEPNDERLWSQVRDTIRLFLRDQWRAGAMMGQTEDQAFFVACDRSTMTQDDILGGRLVCEIGVAPVRPAEFVVFRVYQNTADAQP